MRHEMSIRADGDRAIVIERTFSAPRSMVWDALTRPEFLRRWLFGPPGWEMTECEEDPRVGGKFRWAWRGPNGFAMAMHGEYREVVRPERIVRTETFDTGCPSQAGEQVGTLTLEENARQTRMTLRVEYPSKEARDGAMASGMEHGMRAGYERLDSVLGEVTHD